LQRTSSYTLTSLFLLGLAVALPWPRFGHAEGPTDSLPVVGYHLVAQDRYAVEAAYAGRVRARRESSLGFERAGRIDRVLVDEGDRVEAGTLLAALDTRALEARERQLEATAQAVASRLELARVTTERRRNMRESDYLSPQSLDEARFNEQALQAERQASLAAIEDVKVALDLSHLRAPYSGQIVRRHADEGTVVSPGQPLLELIEDAALEVQIGLPPEVANELAPDSRHAVEIAGRRLDARFRQTLTNLDPETRSLTALFDLVDPPKTAHPGALARIRIARSVESRGFWVPLSALSESRRGLWSVYALAREAGGGGAGGSGEQRRIDRRQIEVLHTEAERVYVRGTLRDGEWIVASGVHRVAPGQTVHVVEEARLAAVGAEGARAPGEGAMP